MVEDILEHHGIKGMKWGVRRTDAQIQTDKVKRQISEDAANAHLYKKVAQKHGTSVLSNKQLQELNKRLNLEKSYQEWADKNPSLKKKATDFIIEELKNEGKKQLGLSNQPSSLKVIGDMLKQASAQAKAQQKPPKAQPRPQPKPKTHGRMHKHGNVDPIYNITTL